MKPCRTIDRLTSAKRRMEKIHAPLFFAKMCIYGGDMQDFMGFQGRESGIFPAENGISAGECEKWLL